jgi:hypothetical protein
MANGARDHGVTVGINSIRSGAVLTNETRVIPKMTLSMGLTSFGFPPGCHPATGLLALTQRTVSDWTRQPLLVARGVQIPQEDAVELQPKVIVQTRRRMLLNAVGVPPVGRASAGGSGVLEKSRFFL